MHEFLNTEPIAANDDPSSSHITADEITVNGTRNAQKAVVLRGVRLLQDVTSAELARRLGITRHITGRRLPDLEADGLVVRLGMRACTVTGRKVLHWGPVSNTEANDKGEAQ